MTAFSAKPAGGFGEMEMDAFLQQRAAGSTLPGTVSRPNFTTYSPNPGSASPAPPHPSMVSSHPATQRGGGFFTGIPQPTRGPTPGTPEFNAAAMARGISYYPGTGLYFTSPPAPDAAGGPGLRFLTPEQAQQAISMGSAQPTLIEQLFGAASHDALAAQEIMRRRVGEYTGDLAMAEQALRRLPGEARRGGEEAIASLEQTAGDLSATAKTRREQAGARAEEISKVSQDAFFANEEAQAAGVHRQLQSRIDEINSMTGISEAEKQALIMEERNNARTAVAGVQASNRMAWQNLKASVDTTLSGQLLQADANEADLLKFSASYAREAALLRKENAAIASQMQLAGWMSLADYRLKNPEAAISMLGPLLALAGVATAPNGRNVPAIGGIA